MKKTVLPIVSLVLAVAGFGQSYESSIDYDRKKQDAFVIDFGFSQEAVQNAIVGKMGKFGYKPKEEKGLFNRDKGFLVYNSAVISDINTGSMDYLVKVERKNRKEKEESTLYLVVLKNSVNAKTLFTAAETQKAKDFLNNLLTEVEASALEIQIREQTEVLAKSEKKLNSLREDKAGLEKKLADNKLDLETAQKDWESQKQSLDLLISRRKI